MSIIEIISNVDNSKKIVSLIEYYKNEIICLSISELIKILESIDNDQLRLKALYLLNGKFRLPNDINIILDKFDDEESRDAVSSLLLADNSQTIISLIDKISHIEIECKEFKESRPCNICLHHEKNIVFMPCRHFSVCLCCSYKLTLCIYCKKDIEYTINVFNT